MTGINRCTLLVVILIGAGLGLTACGGGGARTNTEITSTTVSKGQALIDLKRALDAGVITEREFEREKARILAE